MLAKKNNHGPELEAKLKKRVKAANKSGRLDLSTTPNCQFNFKYVPSLVYQTFGKNNDQQHTLAEQKKKEEEERQEQLRNEAAEQAAREAEAQRLKEEEEETDLVVPPLSSSSVWSAKM